MVKAHWNTEELIENWTLLPPELELVKNKVGGNQIGESTPPEALPTFCPFS